jgi:iron complex outermembrane receptor protein
VFGQPLDSLRLIGGVTWLDAEYTSGGLTLPKGKSPIGTPELQANFNVEWDLPVEGLTLDGRVMYTSSQYVDTANTLEIDSYVRLDLGARYTMEIAGKPFTVRGRIENVTNENDWVSAGGYPFQGYMVLGSPRTYLVSASIDF